MWRFCILLIFHFIGAVLYGQTPKEKDPLKIKTYHAQNGWGYDIYRNGKVLIHQPHIPAITGNAGFTSEADAKKCAALMKYKISKNIMPPTVETKELDSLKIKH